MFTRRSLSKISKGGQIRKRVTFTATLCFYLKSIIFCFMKYFYERPAKWQNIGSVYECNHPMYNRCTLFKNSEGLGLGIIQEHFNAKIKARWWGSVDPWIASDIYSHKNFQEYFTKHASKCNENKLYPVFKIRAVMWDLRMKPLKREFWEEF